MIYYNENDPKAARWLAELIAQGHLPHGTIDMRSIEDVRPIDLVHYTQCHFFAGIGGWPLALKLGGVDPSTPLWTGSCPCQPFSTAGRGKGLDDPRHLWPAWRWLIGECDPPAVFGEQVSSPAGREWLDLVSTDLEACGYAFGAADLCAAGVGAPHSRQRLYWVGKSSRADRELADADSAGSQGRSERGNGADQFAAWQTGLDGAWADVDWVRCNDPNGERWRPIEPGTQPLAHGFPERVGLLRGYGNAIVPQVAAAFIEAALG